MYGKPQTFPICLLPTYRHITSLLINTPHQSGIFVKVNEPTLTHHHHPKSIVHLTAHCWCCTFYGHKQTCNNNIYHYRFIRVFFKFSQRFTSLLYHQSLATSDLFTVSTALPFSRVSRNWKSHSMMPFQIGFFHLVIFTFPLSLFTA